MSLMKPIRIFVRGYGGIAGSASLFVSERGMCVSSFPDLYTIGHAGSLEKMDTREFDGDPRGIVWVWEPPNRGAQYVMGVDPTVGRTSWTRYSRVRKIPER
jgi:hypothetical protein